MQLTAGVPPVNGQVSKLYIKWLKSILVKILNTQ